MKHDLERLLEQIGFSSFLSLARIITFSPPRTRSKPPSLEAFYSFPPLYKFHVSCFVFSHFNSLPPASLSLLLHFNRLIRLTQCCTQFKSPGVKILCVLYLHYNVAFTFKCMEIPETKSFISRGFELGTT